MRKTVFSTKNEKSGIILHFLVQISLMSGLGKGNKILICFCGSSVTVSHLVCLPSPRGSLVNTEGGGEAPTEERGKEAPSSTAAGWPKVSPGLGRKKFQFHTNLELLIL